MGEGVRGVGAAFRADDRLQRPALRLLARPGRTDPDSRPARPGAPPIVVVGSTGDPATPYAWAVALSKQLESGVLVTRQGEGHTGYEFSACVKAAVDTYLVDLTVPKAGLTCD